MATIPIFVGSRSWIRIQSPRRQPCPLATITYRDQEGTIHVWHNWDPEVIRCLCHRLRASAISCQRQVRLVAEGYPQPLRCQTRQCHERHARCHPQGPTRSRASVHWGSCWQLTAVLSLVLLDIFFVLLVVFTCNVFATYTLFLTLTPFDDFPIAFCHTSPCTTICILDHYLSTLWLHCICTPVIDSVWFTLCARRLVSYPTYTLCHGFNPLPLLMSYTLRK